MSDGASVKKTRFLATVLLLGPFSVATLVGHSEAHASVDCSILAALPKAVCGDPRLRSEADQLNTIYEPLGKSVKKDLAFLAGVDKTAFIVSIKDGRNSQAAASFPMPVFACTEGRLTENLAAISKTSTASEFIRTLQKEQF
jgi:hypothetical protein